MFDKTGDAGSGSASNKTGGAGSASAAPKLIPAFFLKSRVVLSVIFCIVFCQPFFVVLFILFSVGLLKGFD